MIDQIQELKSLLKDINRIIMDEKIMKDSGGRMDEEMDEDIMPGKGKKITVTRAEVGRPEDEDMGMQRTKEPIGVGDDMEEKEADENQDEDMFKKMFSRMGQNTKRDSQEDPEIIQMGSRRVKRTKGY